MKFTFLNKNKGLSLIEVVIGAGIIGASVVTVISIYGTLTRMSYDNTARIQAAMLAEEGIEAVKTMRDSGWDSNIGTLTNGSTYRLAYSSGAWHSTTSAVWIDSKFERTFTVSSVARDGSSNIVTSGGTTDTGTKLVNVSVAWSDGRATTTKSLQTYIFDIFSN
jgi:Tfp pilus assembly protein PilV